MAKGIAKIFGGGSKPSTPTAVDTSASADADAAEQERLRQLGRAAMLSNGATGVLGAPTLGRNTLLTR